MFEGVTCVKSGVRWGSLGLSIFAAVTMGCSLIFPILSRFLGIRPVFFGSQIVLAICLFLPLWIETKIGALFIIACCGIPWTAVMVFPFTLVAMSVAEEECGMYMGLFASIGTPIDSLQGVLNIFVVIPQILVSVGIGFLINLFDGNLAAALTAGSISAVICMKQYFFFFLSLSYFSQLESFAGS